VRHYLSHQDNLEDLNELDVDGALRDLLLMTIRGSLQLVLNYDGLTPGAEVLYAYLLEEWLLGKVHALLATYALNAITLRESKGRAELKSGANEDNSECSIIGRRGSRNELVELVVLLDTNGNALLRRASLTNDEEFNDLVLTMIRRTIDRRSHELHAKSAVILTRIVASGKSARGNLIRQIELLLINSLCAVLHNGTSDLNLLSIFDEKNTDFVRFTAKVAHRQLITSINGNETSSREVLVELVDLMSN
jgi:hypothetical protein